MNKKDVVTLCIAALIALVVSVLMLMPFPEARVAFVKDYPFEKEYEIYASYADVYINTWDEECIKDDSIFLGTNIDENHIKVTVEGDICKVVAKYPIKFEIDSAGNKIIRVSEPAIYENSSKAENIFFVIFWLSVLHAAITLTFCFIINLIDPVFIYKKFKKKKTKNCN